MTSNRIQIALGLTNEMVAQGFAFFSSVCVDSTSNVLWGGKKAPDSELHAVDTMVFHLPDRAAVVAIQLRSVAQAGKAETYDLRAQVCVQTASDLFPIEIAIANKRGWLRKRYDPHNQGEVDVPVLPFFAPQGQRDRSSYKEMMPSWVLRSGTFATNDEASSVFLGTTRIDPAVATELAQAVLSVKDAIASLATTRIQGMQVSAFAPTSVFPECADNFWSRFNTGYLRRIAGRTA